MSSCPVRNKISETGVAGPLAIARIILGLMLLWAFFDKLFGLGLSTPAGFGWIDGYSPTYYYMMNLEGWFSELFHWLAGAYQVCDVLIMTGLLCLGITLVLGIAKKLTTVFAIIMMLFFTLSALPPTTNPILDYHMVYVFVLAAIYQGNGFSCIGLEERWAELKMVKRFGILE